MRAFRALRHAAMCVSVLAIGCGGNPKPQVSAVAPPATKSTPAPAKASTPNPSDPVAALIATSERHVQSGERELALGHMDKARIEFDRAVNVLLESPYGTRSDARLRDHFERLVDRISAREVASLAAGDGFAEKPSEPASIDELLAVATFERPETPAPETTATVKADLNATAHDIPIPLNERVVSYIELFQGRLRDYLSSGLARGARYLPMIQNVFRAEGLPLDLAYVPLIESAFKPSALSRAKAKGMWQFMSGTALENGLKHDWYIDERADPEKATLAAAKYLRTLHRMFDGDWHLALASYNGGPGRVQRAVTRTGLEDFWDLSASTRHLPRETREYVPMILAAIIIARNPAQYGFEVKDLAEAIPYYEKVTLTRPMDLRRVAEWAGVSIDDVQALNPELRRWTTPVRQTTYEVKVPVGTGDRLRERIRSANATEFAALNWYRVKRGESLVTIARKLGVSRTDLADANGISIKSRVRPGQDLIIPRAPTTLLASRVERPAAEPKAVEATAAVTKAEPAAEETARVVYRVKRGDTLYSIARAFDISVDDIKTWNRLRTSKITPGDRLTLQTSRTRSAQ